MVRCLLGISIGKLAIVGINFGVVFLIVTPNSVCWQNSEVEKISAFNSVERTNNERCVKMSLFENFLCYTEDPWLEPWWRVKISDLQRFCIARSSSFMAIFIQLALIFSFQIIHYGMFWKRSFQYFDPLDLVPSFFVISAATSVLLTLVGISNSWAEVWKRNNIPTPSSPPLSFELIWFLLSALIIISLAEWISLYVLYNREQDIIEEESRQLPSNQANLSDKEHED